MRTVSAAFRAMPRVNFLTPEYAADAALNVPLPIGYGQTNSQPETVQHMLEWLRIEPGNSVLDIGCGSGWTCALTAYLTGPHGQVIGTEIIPELVDFSRLNCDRTGLTNITIHQAQTHQLGWAANAPYDRILVSAAANELPDDLLRQLKPGGRMVIPIQSSIWIINKDEAGAVTSVEKPGYVFVPLL